MDKIKIYKQAIYRKKPFGGYRYSHTEYHVNDLKIASYTLSNKGFGNGFKAVCKYIGIDHSKIEKVVLRNNYYNF